MANEQLVDGETLITTPKPSAAGLTGAATGLQPGGTAPGAQPGATEGSVGTGGGSTAGSDTGDVAKRDRRYDEA